MSLLATPEATPSRLLGVWRYLDQCAEAAELELIVKQTLMPESQLPNRQGDPRGLLQQNIDAGVEIGLFTKSDGRIDVHPDVTATPQTGDESTIRQVLADLLFDAETGDAAFGRALAWFLVQNPRHAPWNDDTMPRAVENAGWAGETGITSDARFTAFRVWAQFLGFAFVYNQGGKTVITPDPTQHVLLQIRRVVESEGERAALHPIMESLAERCPALEGGLYREEAEAQLLDEARPERQLSATSSLALRRLEETEALELHSESDAENAWTLDGDHGGGLMSHLSLA